MTFDYRHCSALVAAVAVSLATTVVASQTPSSDEADVVTSPADAEAPADAADAAATVENDSGVVRYTGTVVRSTPNTRPFELRIDQWSTEADRDAIARIFEQIEDPTAISEALSRMPAIGGFRTIDGNANPIRYAEEITDADGNRKLVILSDRQVNYWEGANAPNPVVQGYTLIEIRFDGQTGEGVATHGSDDVFVDEATNSLAIGNFDDQPAELMGVARLEAGEGFDLDEMMDDVMGAVGIQ